MIGPFIGGIVFAFAVGFVLGAICLMAFMEVRQDKLTAAMRRREARDDEVLRLIQQLKAHRNAMRCATEDVCKRNEMLETQIVRLLSDDGDKSEAAAEADPRPVTVPGTAFYRVEPHRT